MNTKNYIQLTSLIGAMALLSNSATAANGIYANNASALNINLLSDTFMSYAHNGQNISDLFKHKTLYGTMTRFDEYGDDGTTLKNISVKNQNSNSLIKNVWTDVKHLNGDIHYNKDFSKHARFNLFTLGANTKTIDVKYGEIDFGIFGGYINSDIANTRTNGEFGGISAHYKLNRLNVTALTDIGSMNNNGMGLDFNNSWANVALDTSVNFDIDETFLIRPALYVAYTFVASDDLYINNDIIKSENFNFLNIAPSLEFIKEIVPNWYGTFSTKYIAHFGNDNDINVAGVKTDGIDIDNYFDLGLDVEYDFKQFVFGGKVHKQLGGFDGWSGDIIVKYMF